MIKKTGDIMKLITTNSKLMFAMLVLSISGCSIFTTYGSFTASAKRAYTAGDYDKAVLDLVVALKSKPTYEKALNLIPDAFKQSVAAHNRGLEAANMSLDPFKWDEIVAHYEGLDQVNVAVSQLPILRHKKTGIEVTFTIESYIVQLADARPRAAEGHYQSGLTLSASGDDIQVQKKAALEFKAAQRYVANYKDSASRYDASRKAGMKRIAVMPFEDNSGKAGEYGDISSVIVDDIIRAVMNDAEAMEFLELISREQLQTVLTEQDLGMSGAMDESTVVEVGKLLSVHEILTGKISLISYAPPTSGNSTRNVTKNVVIKTEKYKDEKGKTKEKNIYGDVKASVTTYTTSSHAEISGSFTVVDVKTSRILRTESFTGTADFSHKWATYSGDSRALSSITKLLIALNANSKVAPAATEMVNRAGKDLARSLAEKLKEYAR